MSQEMCIIIIIIKIWLKKTGRLVDEEPVQNTSKRIHRWWSILARYSIVHTEEFYGLALTDIQSIAT